MGRRIRPKYDDSKNLIEAPALSDERKQAILRGIDTRHALATLDAQVRADEADDATMERAATRTRGIQALDTLDRIANGEDKTTEIPGVAAADRAWVAR